MANAGVCAKGGTDEGPIGAMKLLEERAEGKEEGSRYGVVVRADDADDEDKDDSRAIP